MKYIFTHIVSIVLIFIWVYAAISKALTFETFQAQLAQSPIVSPWTGVISYGLIFIEIFVSVLLILPKYRRLGLFFSIILISSMTFYIFMVLKFSPYIPCSCGGILEKMNWSQHLIFNCVILIVSFLSYLMVSSLNFKQFVKGLLATLLGGILVFIGFIFEDKTQNFSNSFIRKYNSFVLELKSELSLRNSSLYFSGYDKFNLYLSDRKAPLYVFTLSKSKNEIQTHNITLDSYDFPFNDVVIEVDPPNFWLIDRSIPAFFKGDIKDWHASFVETNLEKSFSKFKIINDSILILRLRKPNLFENTICKLKYDSDSVKFIKFYNEILTKQIDGIFDTDGILINKSNVPEFCYLYYYRNEYICLNTNTSETTKGNTIDPFNKAQIEIVLDKSTGENRLKSNQLIVNKNAAISNDLLFVNSNIKGMYENEEMWSNASIIDVYDLNNNSYISSFYIHHLGGLPLREMLIVDNQLYVLFGNKLRIYTLNHNAIFQKRNKNISADIRDKTENL